MKSDRCNISAVRCLLLKIRAVCGSVIQPVVYCAASFDSPSAKADEGSSGAAVEECSADAAGEGSSDAAGEEGSSDDAADEGSSDAAADEGRLLLLVAALRMPC